MYANVVETLDERDFLLSCSAKKNVDELDNNLWTCDTCVPVTPPLSPRHEGFSEVDNTSVEVGRKLKPDPSVVTNDCMWSGPGLKAVGIDPDAILPRSCNLDDSATWGLEETMCVDPSAVFPFPVSESRIPTNTTLGLDTPSESENTEEDDEEDDEIDVVSCDYDQIDRRKASLPSIISSRSILTPRPPSSSAQQVAAMHNYSSSHHQQQHPATKIFHQHLHQFSSTTQTSTVQHKYTLSNVSPSSPSSSQGHKRSYHSGSSSPSRSSSKRQKHSSVNMKKVAQKLKLSQQYRTGSSSSHSSRCASDSDDNDCTKRAQHNVLERKRRNDLKESFQTLRENVPELAALERAPKVTILRKSEEYIRSLEREQVEMCNERRRLQDYQRKTQIYLASLQRK